MKPLWAVKQDGRFVSVHKRRIDAFRILSYVVEPLTLREGIEKGGYSIEKCPEDFDIFNGDHWDPGEQS